MKKNSSFYSIYFNVMSIILVSLCLVITINRDRNMFIVSIILLVIVIIELISNIIHFIKINKKID
ncbi:MAG: hypothetical protein IKF36_00455 [Bacilli bacterium]|nr:hypothetical protein [Bacilli bacterium]